MKTDAKPEAELLLLYPAFRTLKAAQNSNWKPKSRDETRWEHKFTVLPKPGILSILIILTQKVNMSRKCTSGHNCFVFLQSENGEDWSI